MQAHAYVRAGNSCTLRKYALLITSRRYAKGEQKLQTSERACAFMNDRIHRFIFFPFIVYPLFAPFEKEREREIYETMQLWLNNYGS